jgi:Uma2 family endonuclease
MSASLRPLTLDEFLDWERSQPERYEFDGIQPVAMTGGGRAHSLIATRVAAALVFHVKPPCEAHGPELNVITTGRVRYPDASVVCNYPEGGDDTVAPTAIFEVLSPSTALTDRRVKAIEYAAVPSVMVYVLLEQNRPEITVRRRSAGWEAEVLTGLDATLELPEIEVAIPLAFIYDIA